MILKVLSKRFALCKKRISKTSLPFIETGTVSGDIVRRFSSDVSDSELIWHRDRENRIIEILAGDGWMFQYDNSVPKKIKKGDVLFINKNEWHRVTKGSSDLIIKINKF